MRSIYSIWIEITEGREQLHIIIAKMLFAFLSQVKNLSIAKILDHLTQYV